MSIVRSRTLPTVTWVHACEWSHWKEQHITCVDFSYLTVLYRANAGSLWGYGEWKSQQPWHYKSVAPYYKCVTHSLSFNPYPLYVLMAWRGFYLDRDWLLVEWSRLDSCQSMQHYFRHNIRTASAAHKASYPLSTGEAIQKIGLKQRS
jgi:nitrite reductase/ring-hydroxylating ferredoxin subunit